ncbi:variant erythrocyte surface antigen-1 family protein [Babesia caballi]|uniref:Variant erythrocyte surface antigen-1 family protein n=1 Tax=Babesia caballi TaxID=5871 RepID=A0AAV4LQ07_BABCB|nr:variant erythrocyte surface antigen-1 family protein [Babesia caballi]
MEEKPLNQPPTNLKEALDWLALVGGGWGGRRDKGWEGEGKHKELKKALKQLDGFDDTAFYNHDLGDGGLSEIIKRYAQALGSGFLGYNGWNSETVSRGSYTSAYSGASWSDNNAFEYAKIFLFLACLVFYFITFLYWMCHSGGQWANQVTYSGPVDTFLREMGFPSNLLNREKLCSHIADRLESGNNVFPELNDAYNSDGKTSYETFLLTLERNGPTNNIYVPLTNCMMLSYAYLKSRHSGTEITNAIGAIKGELVTLSKIGDSSNTDKVSALKQKVQNLLDKIKSFDPNAVSSPVAPIASALTTVAAAGAAGAAYGLNLGGFQGIVKALFGFK